MKITLALLFSLLFIFGCSSESADKLFQEGNELIGQEKFVESLEVFNRLLTEYPESNLAPKAVMTIAGLYQSNKVLNFTLDESLKIADSLFRSVYDKYPESPEAPTGLFMSGFIQANEIGDFNSATETYNLFIEKFPNHDLVVSCREELENMGLSPDEILQKKNPDQVVKQ